MEILSLCGSIRNDSSNYALLLAVKKLLPQSTGWVHFDIKRLPFFDPKLQFSDDIPQVVQELRALAHRADCILISTPEYAHGIPGILKNSLEWLICEETMKKKVALLISSPTGGEYVLENLTETLRTMDLLPAPELILVLTKARSQVSPEGDILDEQLLESLKNYVQKIGAS